MCWKIDTPTVSKTNTVTTTATELVPQTTAPAPESPIFGGTEDTFKKKTGKSKLKINPITTDKKPSYSPVNL